MTSAFAFPEPAPPPVTDYFFTPEWPAPGNVKSMITTRLGGVSEAPYAALNLALHAGDNEERVRLNRAQVAARVPAPIIYLNQVHGIEIKKARRELLATPGEADGIWTDTSDFALAILTADCLPILLCNREGSRVAILHAGWRGLASGIIQNALAALACPGDELLAYLGPAISQDAFEVGLDVAERFLSGPNAAYRLTSCFEPVGDGKYLADLYGISRKILNHHRVTAIYGGEYCTVLQNKYFYSYRKEGKTGRFASLIWRE